MPSVRRGLFALALLVACGPEPGPDPRAVVHDLVAEHSLGEVRGEPGTVDLGTAAARSYLASGWSWNETAGDGTTFVWSEGEASAVDFFLARPRELALTFRAFPFTYDGAQEQAVEVTVNGHRVAQVALAPGPGEHRVALPAAALAAGSNRLLLRYRWSRSPAQTGASGDRRRLAVGWDWLRFGDGEGAAAPRDDPEAGRLLLPYGGQVDHFLDLPAGSALALAGVSAQGTEPGRLEVLLAREDGEEGVVGRLEPGSGARTLELPAAERDLGRLSLRAVGNAGAGGLVLSRPAILAPPEATEARASAAAAQGTGAGASGETTADSAPRPPILVYLVDTLRADRLGCYGFHRPTSPRLDAFARGAFLFENALAQTSWTKPAVASLLTGLPPRRHGVNHPEDGLPEGITLLAQRLAAEGYATAGFTANAHVSPASGFARGFDHFDYRIEEPNDAAAVNRRVFTWLESADPGRPFFLFVHTIDPHAPYQPPEPYRRRFAARVADPAVGSVESIRAIARGEVPVTEGLTADLLALYDAEVAANDAAFGELLDQLERLGRLDQTLVVFLSDHGEQFHEHGVFGHGWDLYGEVLRVPLLLRLPGQRRGRRVARPVQQIDLLPTLLTYLGLPVPGDLPGTDLLRLAYEEPPPDLLDQRPLHAYMDYEEREGAAVLLGDWHLIEPLTGRFAPAPELYHHRQDPGQHRDLAAHRPVLAGYLRRLVRAHLQATAGTATPTAVHLDPATRRQLEALGYL